MFRHQMCHLQVARFVTLLNYISTIATLAKLNQVFKTLKVSVVIKLLLLYEVCMAALYTICVLMLLLSLPGTLVDLQIINNTRYMY